MLENCKIKCWFYVFVCAYGIIISFSFQHTNNRKNSHSNAHWNSVCVSWLLLVLHVHRSFYILVRLRNVARMIPFWMRLMQKYQLMFSRVLRYQRVHTLHLILYWLWPHYYFRTFRLLIFTMSSLTASICTKIPTAPKNFPPGLAEIFIWVIPNFVVVSKNIAGCRCHAIQNRSK